MALSGKAKYQNVVSSLRDGIVKGLYRPGHQLPTRPEMVEKFGVSIATVQRALDTLSDDGFIRARAGSGTFVVDRPPHLCNYAISMPKSGQWSCFFDSLRGAMKCVGQDKDINFREYITSRDVGDRQGISDLYSDVFDKKLAGIIITGDPADLYGTGIMENKAVPCVANVSTFDVPCPKVYTRLEAFLERAVEFLVSRGRRRIAHLFMDFEAHHVADFEDRMRRMNVEVRPYWIQSVAMYALFRSATNVVNLLAQLDGDKKPDALIIHDDNLIEHAVAGLLAAGVRVPEEMEIVAMFNYPSRTHSLLPMTRLGLDMRESLKKSVEILDKMRNGEPVPDGIELKVKFEHEMEK